MDATTAAAVEEAADLAEARQDILPDFLRTVKEDPTHENKTFKKMREMKEREVEHVRYRSSRDHVADASIQAAAQSMRMEARHALKDTQNELRSLFQALPEATSRALTTSPRQISCSERTSAPCRSRF